MSELHQFLDSIMEGLGILEESSGDHSYSCLMLDVPDKITRTILKEILDDDLHEYGKENEVHTTVKYGLHTDDSKEVLDFCKDWDKFPINITLSNFSLFENEDYDVLKLEVNSKELRELNKKICKEFEFTDKFPDYNPHVTLAYLKSGMGPVYVKLLNEKFPDFTEVISCDTLLFSTKDGTKTKKKL